MKRIAIAALVLLIVGGYVAYRAGSNSFRARPTPLPQPNAEGSVAPGSMPTPATAAPISSVPVDAINLASVEFGGRVESVTSEWDPDHPAVHLIDHRVPTDVSWASKFREPLPQDVVVSFHERQLALVGAIAFNPASPEYSTHWAKDVEVWTSTADSPTEGFIRAGGLSLRPEAVEQTLTIAPVEARFVRIRVVSSQTPDDSYVSLGKVKILEAQRAKYVPLLARSPDLAAMIATKGVSPGPTTREPEHPAPSGAAVAPTLLASAAGSDVCASVFPAAATKIAPAYAESRSVLLLARDEQYYPPVAYKTGRLGDKPELSIYKRVTFTRVAPEAATPLLLAPKHEIDTVVLSQVCDIKDSVTPGFKRALVEWIAKGHKLIIQDADKCQKAPDYSFLPYPFATSNPGAAGSKSDLLRFVEENALGNSKPDDPGFLDLTTWLAGTTPNSNEIGDSNTITKYDAHWCGHLFGANILKMNGFMEAYAHYGSGLIIYDGFDFDQATGAMYQRLVTRELAQPFGPDGLPCSARLSEFVLTTEQALRTRNMAPGQTYRYPVTLLSNQGYKGTVHVTASVVPEDPAVSATLERDSIDLVDSSDVQLTVTTSGSAPPSERTIAVRGTDTTGRSNVLCLRLDERRTGSLRVATEFARRARPTKNLEIILDLSGSMKLPLGKSTRIATARRVLRDVVSKIPDDFNVGLRVYGHRYGSRQKETCTDSELVVPIQKLDRNRLLSVIDSTQPRGETPLVYSVLQTAADLKAVGGGSVILITDGEESCRGDPVAAARELKASGVDVNLQILGFTLSGKQVQQTLTKFAQAAGGRYYSAQDGETLGRALLMAAVDTIPYAVFDASGRQVAKGDTASPAIELPPGEYKVVVRAADLELVAEHVNVAMRGESVLKIVMNDERFQLQR